MTFFEFGFLFVMVAMVGGALWTKFGPKAAAPEEWTRATRQCDLVERDAGTYVSGHTHPHHDLAVTLSSWQEGEDEVGIKLVVEAIDRGLVSLTLRPETGATARAKRRGAREIETGDEAFDDDFYLTGPSTPVRAVLDVETRRVLSSLFSTMQLEVVDGQLRGRFRWGNPTRLTLPAAIPALLAAAHRLRRPSDVLAALARNAQSDPEPRVRLENLLALAREYPDHEATRLVLRDRCDDASDEVRARAASALGAEGRRTLLELARTEHVEDMPGARAVAALGDDLPAGEVHGILGRALRTRRLQTARACMDELGRRGQADAVPVLARVLAVEEGSLALSAATALAATGLATAETPLLAALTREPAERRAAAAGALGRVGSAAAVLPLKEVEARYSDDATRRAARQAVAAIQARLPGASHGQLTLAAGDAGALSLAEDETGRLSLDEKTKS